MSKKTFLIVIFSLFLFSVLLAPFMASAACTGGLVPCGRDCDKGTANEHCTLCHFFILIKKAIDFLSVSAAALLVVMVFIGAIMFITAHGSPEWVAIGKRTITAAIIGFIIVLSSWIIVNTIVVFASENSAGDVFGKPWYQIECDPNAKTTNSSEDIVATINEAEEDNFTIYGVDSSKAGIVKTSPKSLLAGILGIGDSLHRSVKYYPKPDLIPYSSGVGIQNARFGSRFNLNFHFDKSRNKTWSSTMGSFADQKTSFIVATRLGDGSVYRFPPSDQGYPEYPINQQIEVLPDRQRIYGVHPKDGKSAISTSLSTVSPFSPSSSLSDVDNIKLSTAPFFYNEVALYNHFYDDSDPNNDEQKGQVIIAFDHFHSYKEINYEGGKLKIIYYKVPEDGGGLRALAIYDPADKVTWGHGDGIFDEFKAKGKLPCKTGNTGAMCKVGGSQWNAGAFVINFYFKKGEKKEKAIVFTYAGFTDDNVLKDYKGNNFKLYYRKFFNNINDVIVYGVKNYDSIITKTTDFTNNVRGGDKRSFDWDAQWTFSQALHSYIANSWLVFNSKNQNDVRYYVAEGNCGFLSTVDVSHETGIFEGEYIPWALKAQLNEWKSSIGGDQYGNYLFHDRGRVKAEGYNGPNIITKGAKYDFAAGGLMATEENLNYVLLSYWYWKKTGDKNFILENKGIFKRLLASVQNRDSDKNGMVDIGDDRTTFDFSLNPDYKIMSLAKENTYLGVKTFGAFVAASEMMNAIGDNSVALSFNNSATKTKNTLLGIFNKTKFQGQNYLPVSDYHALSGWGTPSSAVFDGLTYLILSKSSNANLTDFINRTGKSLLLNVAHCRRSNGYRILALPDISHPEYYDPPEFRKTWVSKTFNTATMLKYLTLRKKISSDASKNPHNVSYSEIVPKAKSLLKKSQLGYFDSWYTDTGAVDTLYLYPRGVSVLGLKLIR